ncbi:hypothetical protein [Vibrio splendidus]|uniref:hypothetical protein n=1 Tax=Vibrio splendidus TaxID=29497 RepID=UPI000C85B6C3|nr:hypothetical protein [Vibrio splendidus]PMI53117.1 hypothetical protein BCU42_02605 [Vibrio splendidus]
MHKNPYSIWFLICTSFLVLISFGTLIGVNIKLTSTNTGLLGSAWANGILSSLLGAIIGALLGAYGTFKTSNAIQERGIQKVKDAYYDEIEHISTYLIGYLEGVAEDYCKYTINLNNNDGYCGPSKVDFNVLNALEIELIKNRAVFSKDQRHITHNLPSIMQSIFDQDKRRVVQHSESIYRIQKGVSLDIMHRLIQLIFTLKQFVELKDSYHLSNDKSFTNDSKRQTAFNLTKIESDIKQRVNKELEVNFK